MTGNISLTILLSWGIKYCLNSALILNLGKPVCPLYCLGKIILVYGFGPSLLFLISQKMLGTSFLGAKERPDSSLWGLYYCQLCYVLKCLLFASGLSLLSLSLMFFHMDCAVCTSAKSVSHNLSLGNHPFPILRLYYVGVSDYSLWL